MPISDDVLPLVLSNAIGLPLKYGYRCCRPRREERFHEESRPLRLHKAIRDAYKNANTYRRVCKKWNVQLITQFDAYFAILSGDLSPWSRPPSERLLKPERVRLFLVQEPWLTPRRLGIIESTLKRCEDIRRMDVSITLALVPSDMRPHLISEATDALDKVASSNPSLKCVTWFCPEIDITRLRKLPPISHLTLGTRTRLSETEAFKNLNTLVLVISYVTPKEFFKQLSLCSLSCLRNVVVDGPPLTTDIHLFLKAVDRQVSYLEVYPRTMSENLESELMRLGSVGVNGVGLAVKDVVQVVTRSFRWPRLCFIDTKSIKFDSVDCIWSTVSSLIRLSSHVRKVFGGSRKIRIRMRDVTAKDIRDGTRSQSERTALAVVVWALSEINCALFADGWEMVDARLFGQERFAITEGDG